MLPGIKIRIPQMEDLLQAEQAYLDVVLEVVGVAAGEDDTVK